MSNCCLNLVNTSLHFLHSAASFYEKTQGYGFNYGANYGIANVLPDELNNSLGYVIEGAEVKFNAQINKIEAVKSVNFNSSCAGSYNTGATLSLNTNCVLDKKFLVDYLGANIIYVPEKIVDYILPAGIYNENFSISENSEIKNVLIKDLNTTVTLEVGIHYTILSGAIIFLMDMYLASGAEIQYIVSEYEEVQPYKNKTKTHALRFTGVNLHDDKVISIFIPKCIASYPLFNLDISNASKSIDTLIEFEAQKSFIKGMVTPVYFTISVQK